MLTQQQTSPLNVYGEVNPRAGGGRHSTESNFPIRIACSQGSDTCRGSRAFCLGETFGTPHRRPGNLSHTNVCIVLGTFVWWVSKGNHRANQHVWSPLKQDIQIVYAGHWQKRYLAFGNLPPFGNWRCLRLPMLTDPNCPIRAHPAVMLTPNRTRRINREHPLSNGTPPFSQPGIQQFRALPLARLTSGLETAKHTWSSTAQTVRHVRPSGAQSCGTLPSSPCREPFSSSPLTLHFGLKLNPGLINLSLNNRECPNRGNPFRLGSTPYQ